MKKQINLEGVTILDLLYILTKKYETRSALQIKDKEGLRKVSYGDLRERSVDVSSFLIASGMEEGAHIAILSENRPEWAIAFFGIISAACVTIPIDAKLSMKEISFILNDSKSKCLFASGKFLELILSNKGGLPHLQYIISFDRAAGEGVLYLDDIHYKEGWTRNRPSAVTPEHTVLIVYTSGTTGVAKGVELTYKNLLFEVMSLYELIRFSTEDSMVSILPLNHMLEITGGLIAPLYGGATITYCDTLKPNYIVSLMKQVRATCMICVPLILRMFYDGITKEIDQLPAFKRGFLKGLLAISGFFSALKMDLSKFLLYPIHKKFGRRFKYFVSGGAPLDIELEKNFDALGFTVLQGYGLTETSPVLSVNNPQYRRYGSVGRPLRGVEVKILKSSENAKDGEIIVKGPNVMRGYYNSPEKTSEVLKDGWFYTGDIGYLDKDSFLFISGRAKNLIVLGGGKKIFPEEVEQVMAESPYIKEICVLGRKATSGLKSGTEEVFAVVVPDLDKFEAAVRENREEIKKRVASELGRLSQNLAEYKKISDFMLYFEELPKTSTRKIKRNAVKELISGQ